MGMLERITSIINEGIVNREPSKQIAKGVIHALREPDNVDPMILIILEKNLEIGLNKAWDAALDQIVDPD